MRKLSVFLLILSFAFCFFGCTNETGKGSSTSSTTEPTSGKSFVVNGEAVEKSEIDYFKNRIKNQILAEYAEEYNITDFSDFWDSDYNGRSPKKDLEERSVSMAVRAKVELVEMKKEGIYDDISFDRLMEKALQYNKEHENVKNTVGILSIDMNSFYTYYLTNGEHELKNIRKIKDADFDSYIDKLVEKADGEIS